MVSVETSGDGVRGLTDRRVVFTGKRQVELQDGTVESPRPHEILIETRRTLISTGTELAHLAGPSWTNPGGRTLPVYPHVTGYSSAGIVATTGEATQRWHAGDRIASSAGHRTYARLAETAWAIPIPAAVSDEEAAFCTLGATVLNGCRIGTPQLGEDAVVIGLGLLGQLLAQYLRLAGCRTVIALDVAPARLEIAERIGAATHLIQAVIDDPMSRVQEFTGGRGADVVYEVTGRTETYDLAFALARFHGRVVGLGSPRQPALVDMQQVHMKALRILGAIVASHPAEDERRDRWSRRANGELFMELVANGQLKVRDLITDRVPAAEAPRAYHQLLEDRGQHLGVILEW